ncbi:MAG: hypothetical protein KKH37_02550, partial [Alphaproteobacteria bacterium]|nr:hypothetical protein [Alphaproteobacteria bacterium]
HCEERSGVAIHGHHSRPAKCMRKAARSGHGLPRRCAPRNEESEYRAEPAGVIDGNVRASA